MSEHAFTVGGDEEGARLDLFLARHVEGLGRAAARRLILDDRVRVNERRLHKGDRLRPGDSVEIRGTLELGWTAAPDRELGLTLLYEDPDLVVVDKPAGIPAHPLRAGERGTIAGALLARYPEMATVGYSSREPGILHRLDNETSGVLLAARTTEAFETLREDLRAGRIEKEYLAIVHGALEGAATIAFPLAPHPKNRRKMTVCRSEVTARRLAAQPAETAYRVEQALGAFTLVRVTLGAARRHQIRAHLAAAGHPIVGDPLYGGEAPLGTPVARHLLHAERLRFRHPRSGQPLEVVSPSPDDLRRAILLLARAGP